MFTIRVFDVLKIIIINMFKNNLISFEFPNKIKIFSKIWHNNIVSDNNYVETNSYVFDYI